MFVRRSRLITKPLELKVLVSHIKYGKRSPYNFISYLSLKCFVFDNELTHISMCLTRDFIEFSEATLSSIVVLIVVNLGFIDCRSSSYQVSDKSLAKYLKCRPKTVEVLNKVDNRRQILPNLGHALSLNLISAQICSEIFLRTISF